LGSLVDRLLLAKGIGSVDADTRSMLLGAFLRALRDAMEHRERNAKGDYAPDPQAQRFPEWRPRVPTTEPPSSGSLPKQSLMGLVEDWWSEAKAAGQKRATYDNHRNSMAALVAFFKHDDAGRATAKDIVAFKAHRLATINPRNGKPLSPKTVKDTDLAGARTVFGWAVLNHRLATNPATGITIKLGKPVKLRPKGFSETEAAAILSAASNLTDRTKRLQPSPPSDGIAQRVLDAIQGQPPRTVADTYGDVTVTLAAAMEKVPRVEIGGGC
jgi:hypothetical protein